MKKRNEAREKELCLRPPIEVLSSNPAMLVNEISRLFFEKMRASDPQGCLSQEGCRLILRALAHTERGGGTYLSQRELARATHLRPPTICRALRDMLAEGLVSLSPDERDARASRVCLTDAGRAAHAEIRARLSHLEAMLLEGLSQSERTTLAALLLRMRENILSDLEENGR